jgi:hypothetical protein
MKLTFSAEKLKEQHMLYLDETKEMQDILKNEMERAIVC